MREFFNYKEFFKRGTRNCLLVEADNRLVFDLGYIGRKNGGT